MLKNIASCPALSALRWLIPQPVTTVTTKKPFLISFVTADSTKNNDYVFAVNSTNNLVNVCRRKNAILHLGEGKLIRVAPTPIYRHRGTPECTNGFLSMLIFMNETRFYEGCQNVALRGAFSRYMCSL